MECLLITNYARQLVERWKNLPANQRQLAYPIAQAAERWLLGRDSQVGESGVREICPVCDSERKKL